MITFTHIPGSIWIYKNNKYIGLIEDGDILFARLGKISIQDLKLIMDEAEKKECEC